MHIIRDNQIAGTLQMLYTLNIHFNLLLDIKAFFPLFRIRDSLISVWHSEKFQQRKKTDCLHLQVHGKGGDSHQGK